MKNRIIIITVFLLPLASYASMYPKNAISQEDCTARVEILESQPEIFSFVGIKPKISTYYTAKLVEHDCPQLLTQRAEYVSFVAGGGRIEGYLQKISGYDELKAHDIALVKLSPQNADFYFARETKEQPLEKENEAAFNCTRVSSKGPSLFWSKRTVVINPFGMTQDSNFYDEIKDALRWGARQWNAPECSDFKFEIGHEASISWVGYNWRTDGEATFNQNIVVEANRNVDTELNGWSYDNTALAITTLTFNEETGEIYDGDIELNTPNFAFTDCSLSSCLNAYDLKGVLTHEMGHLLGLDHPAYDSQVETVMQAATEPGELEKRTLKEADIAGLCQIYPTGQPHQYCLGAEVQSSEQQLAVKTIEGLSCNSNSGSQASFWLISLVFLFLLKRKA